MYARNVCQKNITQTISHLKWKIPSRGNFREISKTFLGTCLIRLIGGEITQTPIQIPEEDMQSIYTGLRKLESAIKE